MFIKFPTQVSLKMQNSDDIHIFQKINELRKQGHSVTYLCKEHQIKRWKFYEWLKHHEPVTIDRIHEKLIRNIFLNLEIWLNEGITEIFEYDIQAFMLLFLKKWLRNSIFSAEREKEGKVDCVIYQNKKPAAFYELKTYFKSNENLNKKDVDKDLKKLFDILETKSQARGYFVIAGKKSKFRACLGIFPCIVS